MAVFSRAQGCNRQLRRRLDQRERENGANDAEYLATIAYSPMGMYECTIVYVTFGHDALGKAVASAELCLCSCHSSPHGTLSACRGLWRKRLRAASLPRLRVLCCVSARCISFESPPLSRRWLWLERLVDFADCFGSLEIEQLAVLWVWSCMVN